MNIFSHIYYIYGSKLVATEIIFVNLYSWSLKMTKASTSFNGFGTNLGSALRKAKQMPTKTKRTNHDERQPFVKRELRKEQARYSLATFMQRGIFEFKRGAVAALTSDGLAIDKLPAQMSIGCTTFKNTKDVQLYTVGETAGSVENGAYAIIWANNRGNPVVPYEVRRDTTEGSCALHTTSNTKVGEYACLAVQVGNNVVYGIYLVEDFTQNPSLQGAEGQELAPFYVNMVLVWAGSDSFASAEPLVVKLEHNGSNNNIHLNASLRRMVDVIREKIRNPDVGLGAYIQHWRPVTPPGEGQVNHPDSIWSTWNDNKDRIVDLIEDSDTEENVDALDATFVNTILSSWMLTRTVDKLLFEKSGKVVCVLRVQRMTADDDIDDLANPRPAVASNDLYRLTVHVVTMDNNGVLHYCDAGQFVYGNHYKVFGMKCSVGITPYGDIFYNAYKNGRIRHTDEQGNVYMDLQNVGDSVYIPLQTQRSPVLSFYYPKNTTATAE